MFLRQNGKCLLKRILRMPWINDSGVFKMYSEFKKNAEHMWGEWGHTRRLNAARSEQIHQELNPRWCHNKNIEPVPAPARPKNIPAEAIGHQSQQHLQQEDHCVHHIHLNHSNNGQTIQSSDPSAWNVGQRHASGEGQRHLWLCYAPSNLYASPNPLAGGSFPHTKTSSISNTTNPSLCTLDFPLPAFGCKSPTNLVPKYWRRQPQSYGLHLKCLRMTYH